VFIRFVLLLMFLLSIISLGCGWCLRGSGVL